MCDKHKKGGPVQIGAIVVSSHVICVGCERFEGCDEPPAILARIALELAARRAANEEQGRQALMN